MCDGSTNGLSCPVTDYPDQDAQYGRDFNNKDDSDGHAGFSFTKLDANGNEGLHDADDRYNWYTTDTSNDGGRPVIRIMMVQFATAIVQSMRQVTVIQRPMLVG